MTARRRSPSSTVIALSNRGVKLVSRQQRKDVVAGARCFQAALTAWKQQMKASHEGALRDMAVPPAVVSSGESSEHAAPPAETTSHQQHDEESGGRLVLGAARVQSSSHISSRTGNISSRLGLLKYYLYSSPFRLQRSWTIGPHDDLVHSSPVTAVITFNLALSHHLVGYDVAPKKKAKYWCAALELYGLAKCLRCQEEQVKGTQRTLGALIDLAIDNNAAVLYSELGDGNRALIFFQSLAWRIQQLEVRHQRHDVLQGFVSNLILLRTIRDNAAATAA